MTEGVVWKQLLLFAIPLIAGDFLQQLYSTVDSVIVGKVVGKTALAAVTSTETLINVIIGMFSGISTGATIVIARFFGAKKDRKISDAVQTVAVIAAVMGVLMTLAGVFLSPALLELLDTPKDVLPEAREYLRIYFCGMIGLVVYNMASGVLRAVGDSVRPLIALFITAILNVGLDLLFVKVLGMGVAGAAYATIIAIFASAIYLLILMTGTDESYRLDIRHLKYCKDIASKVFGIGVPMGFQRSVVAFSNLMVIAHVNYFGSGASAGWGVYRKVDVVVMHIMSNMGQALSTCVSQNLGAGKKERVKKSFRFALIFTVAITALMDLSLLLLRVPVVKLFNDAPDVIFYGSTVFLCMLLFQPFMAVTNVVSGKIRGYGDSKGPTVIMILCMVVLRQIYLNIGWMYTKDFIFVISSYPLTWILCAVFMVLYDRLRYGKKKSDM